MKLSVGPLAPTRLAPLLVSFLLVGCGSGMDGPPPGFNDANPNQADPVNLRWQQLPGGAVDVAAGSEESVLYVVGTDRGADGNSGIYKWTATGWLKLDGGATAIDVGKDEGSLWVTTANGGIFRRVNGAWVQIPGFALDVGVGADESVWVVGTDHAVYRWNGAGWEYVAAFATRIDVDPNGLPWVIGAGNAIFRYNGTAWEQMPGFALDVGIGATGDVYIVGTDNAAYRWNGSGWTGLGGWVSRISGTAFGEVFTCNSGGGIFLERAAAQSGPTYLGCYADAQTRDLPVQLPGQGFTSSTCVAACAGANYKFAAVQFQGSACFCGNTYGAYGASAACTTPCTANPAEICGGAWANSVYKADYHQLTGVTINGQQLGCSWTEPSPGSYGIDCGNGKLKLSGLHGIIRSTTDFSLIGTVGDVAGQLGFIGGITDFLNANIVTGLNSARVRIDGPGQGPRVTVTSTLGLGAGFDGLSQALNDLSGVDLSALHPQVRLIYEKNHLRVDSLVYEGNATSTVPEIGTGFTIKSVRLKYDQAEGNKVLTVWADTDLRPTAKDAWVPAKLKLVRDVSSGLETITGNAHFTGWTKPFGFVPVNVDDAELAVGFVARKLASYRIQINRATAMSYTGTYTLAGSYAIDRPNQLFAFELTTPEVPLTLMMQMIVQNDPTLLSVFKALKLDGTMIRGYGGQNARFVLSPTGGTILGRTYEKKSYVYGSVTAVVGDLTIPAVFDLSGEVSRDSAGNYSVNDFAAKVWLDLVAFTNGLKAKSTAAADILNAFSIKTVSIDIARTANVWSGGANATLHLCGIDQTIGFDTNNVPKIITDALAFIANTTQACINNATCPATYERGGLLCYPMCAPGYHSDGATQCYPDGCPPGTKNPYDGNACPVGTCYDATVPTFATCDGRAIGGGATTYPASSGAGPCCANPAKAYSRGAGVPLVYPN